MFQRRQCKRYNAYCCNNEYLLEHDQSITQNYNCCFGELNEVCDVVTEKSMCAMIKRCEKIKIESISYEYRWALLYCEPKGPVPFVTLLVPVYCTK